MVTTEGKIMNTIWDIRHVYNHQFLNMDITIVDMGLPLHDCCSSLTGTHTLDYVFMCADAGVSWECKTGPILHSQVNTLT